MNDIAQQIADETLKELDAQLPVPVGFKLLVALPDVEETFDGTEIAKVDSTMKKEYIMSIMGVVLDMGNDAYKDEERYPNGPWCKVGDFVMFRMNTGTRFRIGDKEYRLMNDDSVEAVVADPRGVCPA